MLGLAEENAMLKEIARRAAPLANTKELVIDFRDKDFGRILLDLEKLGEATRAYYKKYG